MEDLFNQISSSLVRSFTNVSEGFVEILPDAIKAIIIIIIGLLLASGLHFATKKVLDFFAVDKLAGKTPISKTMKNLGISRTISDIVSLLVFWLVIFLTLVFVSDVLELKEVSSALGAVAFFIPQIIAALLIVVFGMLFARFLESLVVTTISQAGISFANTIGKAVYTVVLIFVFLLVFEQLGFNLTFLTTNVIILLSIAVLIGGVGFVLASRSLFENAVACHQLRGSLRLGAEVEIGEHHGKIRGFTFTSVILSKGNDDVVIPASSFLVTPYSIKVSHD